MTDPIKLQQLKKLSDNDLWKVQQEAIRDKNIGMVTDCQREFNRRRDAAKK